MTKLYFLGGEDIKKRDSKKINKKALSDAGQAPTVLIFPWAREIENPEYRPAISNYFKKLGADKIEFAELSDPFQKIKEEIRSADMIYLPGGNSKILVKRLKDAKVDSLLKKYEKVIVGNSAGAHALCEKYIGMKGQDNRQETEVAPGIGLVDFGVVVHYDASCSEELRRLSEKTGFKIYAIQERCALIYDAKRLEFIGNIYLFYKGKKDKMRVIKSFSATHQSL